MRSNEKLTPSSRKFEITSEHGTDYHEQIRKNIETAAEAAPDNKEVVAETARHEALENAVSVEADTHSPEQQSVQKKANSRGSLKHEREQSYQHMMNHVQSELSPSSRAFSKIIHTKAVEQASDFIGATVARPNAVLAGAIAAFIASLSLYLVARQYGYRLSGFETIGGFIIGWIVGILFDYLRVMITGKR